MPDISFDDLIPQGQGGPNYGGAISSIESGGRYDILGPVTRTGDRAYGKYQVMGRNIPEWSQEVFGQPISPQQFLANPQLQDALFQAKFGQYVQKYGPEGAARAWFAGEGGMNDLGRRDQLGTSVGDYGGRFSQALGFAGSPQQAAQNQFPAVLPTPRPASAPQASPQKAISFNDLIPQGPPAPPPQAGGGALDAALTPITSYPEVYKGMREEAQGQLGKGIEQLKAAAASAVDPNPATGPEGQANIARGLGNVAMGGLGYIGSPINAALRTFAGTPVEQATGIPKEYTEFAAGLALPGVGMTRLSSTRVPVAAAAATPGQEVAQAAERLSQTGAPVTVPRAVATDSVTTQRAAATLRNVPGGGDPLVKAAETSLGQLGAKASEVAAGYGGASVPGAGATARSAIVDWIGPESKAKVSGLYDKVDNLVNPTVTTDLATTRAKVDEIVTRRANAGDPTAGKAAELVSNAVTQPGGLNYQGVKDLRTRVGEMLNTGILPEGWSQGELKQLYGSLTSDLGKSVENAGGAQAKAAFDRANKYNSLVNDRREALAKIVGSDGSAPAEQVFDRLQAMASSSSRGDISRLAQARKVMNPDEWNEVASAVVGKLGRDVEGNFSPQRFLTAWGKLSDSGKTILFKSGGKSDLAGYLDDIAMISSRWKEMQQFANPSGTSQSIFGGAIGAGFFAEPLTTIATVTGARGLSLALSQPATAAPVAQFARRYQIALQSPTPASIASLTVASRNLANTLSDKLGQVFNPGDFLKAIQGPVPVRADQEQQQPPGIFQ